MPPTATVLAGLSLATGIARDAADGVPIVKQILGVASRVVGLAENIEKNREDLHGLVDRAKKMDATIAAALDDREPGDHMLRRLEDLNAVLRAVEQHFAKHLKRSRVHKVIGYIFTVQKDVERLRADFDDCLREVQVAASLDAAIIARANSKFIGEFRNIRHSELHLLRPLHAGENGRVINYHIATCEGSSHVFVVRNIGLSARSEDAGRPQSTGDHEKILEHLSFVQNRHPAIAYIYGLNAGPRDNRFIVLNTGNVRTLREIVNSGMKDLPVLGRITAKFLDALCHLRRHGAAWTVRSTGSKSMLDVYINDSYEPKIGIRDELSADGSDPLHSDYVLMACILADTLELREHSPWVSHTDLASNTWYMQLLGDLVHIGNFYIHGEDTVQWADIPSILPLTNESRAYLNRAGPGLGTLWPAWGDILLKMALTKKPLGRSILNARYQAMQSQQDKLEVLCIKDDGETVRQVRIWFDITCAEEARKRFGIILGDKDKNRDEVLFLMQRDLRPGATSTERTEWLDWWLN